MSTKLLREVRAEQVEGVRLTRRCDPLLEVRTKIDKHQFGYAFEYSVAVSIGFRGDVAMARDIEKVKADVTRAVADYAYREVRGAVNEAIRLLWSEDIVGARDRLDELLKELE